jgi:hypothetical protein
VRQTLHTLMLASGTAIIALTLAVVGLRWADALPMAADALRMVLLANVVIFVATPLTATVEGVLARRQEAES